MWPGPTCKTACTDKVQTKWQKLDFKFEKKNKWGKEEALRHSKLVELNKCIQNENVLYKCLHNVEIFIGNKVIFQYIPFSNMSTEYHTTPNVIALLVDHIRWLVPFVFERRYVRFVWIYRVTFGKLSSHRNGIHIMSNHHIFCCSVSVSVRNVFFCITLAIFTIPVVPSESSHSQSDNMRSEYNDRTHFSH